MSRCWESCKGNKGGDRVEIIDSKLPSEENCTGCSACVNICLVVAISLKSDDHGFLYPIVDDNKCILCNKCVNICPVNKEESVIPEEKIPECYAAYSKNEKIRFSSTSGGIFTHLAEYILNQNGAVVGARYKKDHLVEHTVIYSEKEIAELRQSKYVQSEIGLVYKEIKIILNSGKEVLFVGTPCQCVGLRSFLGRNYDNLYICDFICRGVNSPKAYKSYLDDLEKKYSSKVMRVWFKNKTYSWNNFATKIVFENNAEYIADRETDPFMLSYIKSKSTINLRKCCYNCRFKGVSRPWSDITLGDFWGIDKISDIETKNGVSAVILHSQKGKLLFDCIVNSIVAEKHDIKEIKQYNPCIEKSAPKPENDL